MHQHWTRLYGVPRQIDVLHRHLVQDTEVFYEWISFLDRFSNLLHEFKLSLGRGQ
jgi:hypothetical protein